MPRSGSRPSIRDVATAAGVSHQTVSRVLNAPEKVSPRTLERVQQSIAELGFRRSMAARSLATNDSRLIGVVSSQSALFGPSAMALAIAEGIRARGYSSVQVSTSDDDVATLQEAREHLLDINVVGVIVLAWSAPALELADWFGQRMPTVVVAEGEVPDSVSRARGDHAAGSAAATELLIKSGRKYVAHLAGPQDWLEAQARLRGWASLSSHTWLEAGWGAASGYRMVEKLIQQAPETDGIVATNDHVAIGAMRWLWEHARDVPRDIAVVGFDDIEIAPFLRVPLASVRQPFQEIGEAAVQLLAQRLAGEGRRESVLPSELVPRLSAGLDASL